MNLTFNKERHEYRLDGAIVPSVTQVIKAARIIDDSFFDEHSRRRGEAVHLATAMYDEGTLDPASVDPEIAGYVEAWEIFLVLSGFQPTKIEFSVANETYRYAGTIDRVGTMAGSPVILDIKTGAVGPEVGLQLAAYEYALDHETNYRRFAVQLSDDGKFTSKEFTDRATDWAAFHAALVIFNWKHNKGIK